MRWPWIGREHHEEVVSAKNAQIRWQQETIAALEARIAAPVAVTVKLPDDFAMVSPAIVASRRAKAAVDPNRKAKIEEPDWANLDENNESDLAKAAAWELGGSATNAYQLAQTIGRIKQQIIRSKLQRNRRTMEEGSVGTITAPEPGFSGPRPDVIPESIAKRIEAAAEGRVQ